ncbi:MAG: anthranilate phosphoribosyltransferase [Gemmatimonadota bacterium]|nr:MAG: anthranilate phosphoribosyltransferase [Gemmatimonadota bacterium]
MKRLAQGGDLGQELAAAAFGQLMCGEATSAQTAGLLTGLRVRGETPGEVAGAVLALREVMVPVVVADRAHLVDTCGTGGGSVSTFNISTAAAMVAGGAGAVVAKHGNRSYTSKCGSADVLEALGVEITIDAAAAAGLLQQVGMVFLFAPAFHPAMRFVAPVRREIGIPTIMNLIGPLANPAGVTRQVVGVSDPGRGPLVAQVLARLGTEHAMVVHGSVGMDEIAPLGFTQVWEVREGAVDAWTLDPVEYGLAITDPAALAGGTPSVNAQRIERLLEEPGADTAGLAAAVLNAGAALYVAGVVGDVRLGFARAREALETGAARAVLEGLRRYSPVSTSE